MKRYYRVPLVLAPQPDGGFTVTSPLLPELVTEGDSMREALANVEDALRVVLEIYEDEARPLPVELLGAEGPLTLDYAVAGE